MGIISTHIYFSLHPATKGQTMQTEREKNEKEKANQQKKHQLKSKQMYKAIKKMDCNKVTNTMHGHAVKQTSLD